MRSVPGRIVAWRLAERVEQEVTLFDPADLSQALSGHLNAIGLLHREAKHLVIILHDEAVIRRAYATFGPILVGSTATVVTSLYQGVPRFIAVVGHRPDPVEATGGRGPPRCLRVAGCNS